MKDHIPRLKKLNPKWSDEQKIDLLLSKLFPGRTNYIKVKKLYTWYKKRNLTKEQSLAQEVQLLKGQIKMLIDTIKILRKKI